MSNNLLNQDVTYQNLLEECSFEPNKPVMENIGNLGATQIKRVLLKAGTRLNCHQCTEQVLVLWLRGKAQFQANGNEFIMHPGSLLEMPAGTPHGATAETDCVFMVFKYKTE